jgi:hypothetical protein
MVKREFRDDDVKFEIEKKLEWSPSTLEKIILISMITIAALGFFMIIIFTTTALNIQLINQASIISQALTYFLLLTLIEAVLLLALIVLLTSKKEETI